MKKAIITGASDGLGKELALKCIADGFEVVCLSRSKPDYKCIHISTDLAEPESIDNAVEIILRDHSDFSVLVNCAAILGKQDLGKITYEVFERAWKVNAISPLYLISRLIDTILKNEADIINIGTTMITKGKGDADQLAYLSSKWGLYGGGHNISLKLKNTRSRFMHANVGGFVSRMHAKDYGKEIEDPADWMDPARLADILVYFMNLPKQIEVSEININRKGRRDYN